MREHLWHDEQGLARCTAGVVDASGTVRGPTAVDQKLVDAVLAALYNAIVLADGSLDLLSQPLVVITPAMIPERR